MSGQPVAGPSGTRGGTVEPATWDISTESAFPGEENRQRIAEGVVPTDETAAMRGWRQFRSDTTPSLRSARSDTVELRDGSIVRRLPSPPTEPLRRWGDPSSDNASNSRDPFCASSDLSSTGTLFQTDAVGSSRDRSDADVQSLASSLPSARRNSFDLSSRAATRAGYGDLDLDEDWEARSPLQPGATSERGRGKAPASRGGPRPYLAPISTSPTRLSRQRQVSADITLAARDEHGWVPLTPTRSAEQGHAQHRSDGPRSAGGLNRNNTLAAAAMDRLRRVSERVVNLQEEDDDDDDVRSTGASRPHSDDRANDRLATPVDRAYSASPSSLRQSRSAHSFETATSKDRDDDETLRLEDEPEDRSDEHRKHRQLRGKTLGIFDPANRFRRACAAVLTAPWTEPAILLLIVLQVIVQAIRSSYDVYTHPRPTRGYFHSWEDVVLFVIFCAFTVEILARIVVTGLVINPPRPELPPDVKIDAYSTPSRTPSIVTRIQSHLSPMRSPASSRPSPFSAQAATSPSRPRRSADSLFPSDAPDCLDLTSALRSQDQHTATYPPQAETVRADDIVAHDYGAEIRGGDVHDFSLKAGLAPTVPVATGHVEVNYAPSTTQGSTATGPGPFAYRFAPYALSIKRQRQTYQHAFLRHSFNRIDLVAVVAFWISFILAMTGAEAGHNLWFFRALSVLRATRLLAITSGTQTILQSLKKASPLLVNVGFFTAFAMLLFSIIGVQAFSNSFKRHCVWIDPQGQLPNITSSQSCGGYYLPGTDDPQPWLQASGRPNPEAPKGYLCGAPSLCIEMENPAGGGISFDNVLAALYQVVIIASANTWTTPMHQMMNADYFVSCLYFIAGLVIINYWMLNLLVAVITNTFADIREETKHSAFAARSEKNPHDHFDDDKKPRKGLSRTSGVVRLGYEKTRLVWVALILVSICFQANRSYDMSSRADRLADWMEFSITLALDAEIMIRIFTYLPDWRLFFAFVANRVDLALAISTTILLLPGIFETAAYRWLTLLQIARFYRVIMVIPRIRRLLIRVLGTITGLANMALFLLLMTFIAALLAVEFFRGIPNPDNSDTGYLTFYQVYDSFLAMYQILSSENWTDVSTTIMANESGIFQIVLAIAFLCIWMLFSYFILCNMFIAVINENFAIADEEKRARQVAAFVGRNHSTTSTNTSMWFRRFDPYTYATTRSRSGTGSAEPAAELVDRRLTSSPDALDGSPTSLARSNPSRPLHKVAMNRLGRLVRPTGIHHVLNYFAAPINTDRSTGVQMHHRDVTYDAEAEALVLATQQQRQQTIADFIASHPSYDKSLYVFKQSSRIRQLCQKLVEPCSGGERLHGKRANKVASWVFQGVILSCIIASIAVAAIATPYYRRQSFLKNGHVLIAWYSLAEVALGSVFVLEFVVKVIADGFVFTPNAYLLSLANDIDFFVLLTVIINISTLLLAKTGDDHFTRSLKAFRALRLINIWPSIRETFYSVLILGASRIMDASILAVLYIIPYAIWASNVFRGLLYGCNDTSVSTKNQCVGEYLASPTSDWTFLAPRVWSNPTVWSFDTFRSSLLILFEIVSLEGWIDVMESVMNITGRDQQPQTKAAQFNALLLVVYNLIGALFILTIFVSVIIESFVRRSGNSLLTTEQRQWQDMRRLIARQTPAKRPARAPSNAMRAWCYERAIHKRGWWARGVTSLYVLNVAALLTQATTTSPSQHDTYNWLFLGFVAAYTIDVAVRLIGLGFKYFFTDLWNAYDLVVIIGVNVTTFPILAGLGSNAFFQLQKVFLVAVVFKLVQRSDSLNQLFKTAAAALPTILNIFALWVILFLTFALFYTEIFGLTRWVSQGTSVSNYYSFASTMVMLALQSTGEGWNQFMHDYTIQWPACTYSPFYLLSDCGSSPWAYTLFILWNILSMYLFVNLVLGAVVESFSFAFQDYGKVTRITRGDMREFKRVWAAFDAERTGYLQPRDVGRFFGRLHGVFEVKIYRDEWSLRNLQASSYRSPGDQHNSPAFVHYLDDRDALSLRRVDLPTLRRLVDAIDPREVAVRRRNFVLAYHEAMHDAEESLKGISFSKMLLLIAHYRLINDDSALQMDELARRRRKRQLIQRRVDNDRVSSFLRMVVLRRRFLDHLESKRRREYGLVPDIVVAEEDTAAAAPADPDEPSTE